MLLSIKQAIEQYSRQLFDKATYINLSLGYGTKSFEEDSISGAEKEAESFIQKRKLLETKSYHRTMLSSIMATMYARRQETEEHAGRIAKLSRSIGEGFDLSQKSLDELELLSMLHDIGKIGIDDRILNKPGKLDEEEWAS